MPINSCGHFIRRRISTDKPAVSAMGKEDIREMRSGRQTIEILRHAQDTSEVGPRNRLGVMIVAENASLLQGGESSLAIQWFRGLLKAGVDVRLLAQDRKST